MRCQAIRLKCQKRTALAVAKDLGCCEMSFNDWMKRFAEHGVEGLKVAKGRGRKSILQKDTDLEAVRHWVQNHRQRISLAKVELEAQLGKQFSTLTLKRFLKKTVTAINECAG
ncbi:MAG TPA: helix-turn-helix domain-containing protein [Hymenobacter sp.]|nr:helix-turn-helix domain-containing protein [Hymenobacter sp.]